MVPKVSALRGSTVHAVFTYSCGAVLSLQVIQWNLRIKDKLVHRPMSTIRSLSFIGGGGVCQKILYFTFYDIIGRMLLVLELIGGSPRTCSYLQYHLNYPL